MPWAAWVKCCRGWESGLAWLRLAPAAIKLGKDLVRAGSDAEEMLGKFNVVMGAQAGGYSGSWRHSTRQ